MYTRPRIGTKEHDRKSNLGSHKRDLNFHPALTRVSLAFTSAVYSSKTSTVSWCPLKLASVSGVEPFCMQEPCTDQDAYDMWLSMDRDICCASADLIPIVCVCVCVITSVSVILSVILRATGKVTEQRRKEGVWRDWHMSLVNVHGFL